MDPRKANPEHHPRRKRFVLVVDGSLRDGTYLGVLLQNLGYTSTVARSAEEALGLLKTVHPALILSELVLPGVNGIDLLGRLAADPALPSIPMIIQTRFAGMEIEDHCRRAGCSACLNKPVQPSELYRAVQQAIEPTPRQNMRVPVLLPLTIDDLASPYELVTMLSDGGLFVRTNEPRMVGSRHIITFLLEERLIRADAVVLYANRFEEDPRKEPGMGMRFENITALDRDVVLSHIREHVRPPIPPESN